MITYRCDGCGKEMAKADLRYVVTIDVKAAYDDVEVHLLDLVRDHRQEILELLARMRQADPEELEEQIFKRFDLDLCPACQKAFLRAPLCFHPEQGGNVHGPVDIDSFLRSLGFGEKP